MSQGHAYLRERVFEGPQKGKPRQGHLVEGVGQKRDNLQHRGSAVPANRLEVGVWVPKVAGGQPTSWNAGAHLVVISATGCSPQFTVLWTLPGQLGDTSRMFGKQCLLGAAWGPA